MTDEPPFISVGAAPHFHPWRPVTLCTDDRADDDDGPPNWAKSLAEHSPRLVITRPVLVPSAASKTGWLLIEPGP